MAGHSLVSENNEIFNQGQNSPASEVSALHIQSSNLDRNGFTDGEYIEILLKEIEILQGHVFLQSETIRQLQHSRSGISVKSVNDLSERLLTRKSNPIDRDIPQRSARRNDENSTHMIASSNMSDGSDEAPTKETNRTSVASITSHGPIDINEGVLLSPFLQTELSAAASQVELEGIMCDSTPNNPAILNNERIVHDAQEFDPRNQARSRTGSNSKKNSMEKNVEETLLVSDQCLSPTPPLYRSRIRLPATRRISESPKSEGESQRLTDDISDISSQLTSRESEARPFDNESPSEIKIPIDDPRKEYPHDDNSRKIFSQNTKSEIVLPDSGSLTSVVVNLNSHSSEYLRPDYSHSEGGESSVRGKERKNSRSSFIVSTKMDEEEDSLFVKPKEFPTIRIKVVSTITLNSKKNDDFNCTFSINDKETEKEMWRFRKTYSQMLCFDCEIRPFIDFFGLPSLPDKSMFNSTTPSKVDSRSQSLQKYFDAIFLMPHIPQMVILRICKYVSVDLVNPLDDFRSGATKEGFLIRRYKGLGTSWKVRWCQIDGPALEIYDSPGGVLIEQINLSSSQIGRQSSEALAEDRGYRHAFFVLETSKSSKISGSPPKHFFCAESDIERDEWIRTMVEFTKNDPLVPDERYPSSLHISSESKESIKGDNEDGDLDSLYPYVQNPSGSNLSLHEIVNDQGAPAAGDDAALKQNVKTKMRHLFPFRTKQGHTEDQDSTTTLTSPPPIQSSGYTMQNYLSELDLPEEQSKSIFGRDLTYAFNLSNHDFADVEVPSVCFRCCDFLMKTGAIYEEGIFRLSGSASTIRLLKDQFNTNLDVDLFNSPLKPDIHTVSGLFKTYLREIPHSIFGDSAYHRLQGAVAENSKQLPQSQVALMIRDILRNSDLVDKIHYDFCSVVLGFLRTVVANTSANKMSLRNVCIVFVPTLNISVEVLTLCLIDYDCIFGGSAPVPDREREVLDLQIPSF